MASTMTWRWKRPEYCRVALVSCSVTPRPARGRSSAMLMLRSKALQPAQADSFGLRNLLIDLHRDTFRHICSDVAPFCP
jgi:hypothetical protein